MTSLTLTVLVLLGCYVGLELLLWLTVKRLRQEFQWLITSQDAEPEIPLELVKRHMESSFDPDLGWLRRPGSKGKDETECGPVSFQIDEDGSRSSPLRYNRSRIAVFGDSFAFCRLVADEDTWPTQLGHMLHDNVPNFGVGNYGFDQALLRMGQILEGRQFQFAIMCVVPETMSRVHSYWKHYFEYGNILAFKPRFTIKNGELVHHRCIIQEENDFHNYKKHLMLIKDLDSFFFSKFSKDVIKFPRLLSIVRRWQRHLPIIWHLAIGKITGDSAAAHRMAVDIILKENAKETAKLYADRQAVELLSFLIRSFAEQARGYGTEPILVIVPQPVDLCRHSLGLLDYSGFFAQFSETLTCIDITEQFIKHSEKRELYVQGQIGPHVSAIGNKIIARTIAKSLHGMISVDRV